MQRNRQVILWSVGVALVGVGCITAARLLVGNASWWLRWGINAVGWLLVATVVIPVTEAIRKKEEDK